jgi:hypothetical protein
VFTFIRDHCFRRHEPYIPSRAPFFQVLPRHKGLLFKSAPWSLVTLPTHTTCFLLCIMYEKFTDWVHLSSGRAGCAHRSQVLHSSASGAPDYETHIIHGSSAYSNETSLYRVIVIVDSTFPYLNITYK